MESVHLSIHTLPALAAREESLSGAERAQASALLSLATSADGVEVSALCSMVSFSLLRLPQYVVAWGGELA
jgi:hypothetical protein